MRNRVAITFVLRDEVIYCRVRLNGDPSEFSTGIRCNKSSFRNGRIVSRKQEDLEKQDEMQQIAVDIRDIKVKKGFTSKSIIDCYLGNEVLLDTIPSTVMEMIDYAITTSKAEGAKKAKIDGYDKAQKSFKKFLASKNVTDISIHSVNNSHIIQFQSWIKDSGLAISTAYQYANHVVMAINKCIKDYSAHPDMIKYNPVRSAAKRPNSQMAKVKSQKNTLTIVEVNKIKDHFMEGVSHIKKQPYEWFRLTVLWQIYTGFSFSDLGNPYWEIVNTMSGKKVIRLFRGKTAEVAEIPFLPHIEEIYNKLKAYAGSEDHIFPIKIFVLDEEMNKDSILYNREQGNYRIFLKRLMSELDFKIKVKSHTLRHTFGMLAINEFKIPKDLVAKMMGHSSSRTTDTYAAISIENSDIEWNFDSEAEHLVS